MSVNTVAIVGRPNVGKSTFFNRLVQAREAIVDDESGITRDRHYGEAEWCGKHFTVIDTGGYVPRSDDMFEKAIREQVDIAVEEANVIIFMLDVSTGITLLEDDIADRLRKAKKTVIPVVNKVDHNLLIAESQMFHRLGMGEIFPISSANGSGTGDLLDEVVSKFPPQVQEVEPKNLPRISILGQPNVGKSSFLNLICGEERMIVTPVAGTTRDKVVFEVNKFGMDFELVDTAGLRKKSNIKGNVEFYSTLRTVRALEISDVCILMIDATTGITHQDMSIFNLILEQGKGVVIAVNKWDLVADKKENFHSMKKSILEKLAPFNDVPVHFISVLEKQRILTLLEEALKVYERRQKRIKTKELNEYMLPIVEKMLPPMWRGHTIRIKFVNQLKSSRPLFAFYCNYPASIKEPYKRFLENRIRSHFDFSGVPIKIIFKPK